MSYLSFIKRRLTPSFGTIYGDVMAKKDPNVFTATGSQIYHGRQRQGKSLSMVADFHAVKRRFPLTFVLSNVSIMYHITHERAYLFGVIPYTKKRTRPLRQVEVVTKDDLDRIMSLEAFKSGEWQRDHYVYYRSYNTLIMLLRHARNGLWGTHFLIDEIHQYFHSHDSKSMPVWVSQIFSQQMKQHILITGTVQKWPNVIKALREQIAHLILCTRHGWYIRNIVIDPEDIQNEYGEMTAPVKKTGGYFMTKLIRESYDTLALVESGREIFGGSNDPVINVSTAETQKKTGGYRRRTAVR